MPNRKSQGERNIQPGQNQGNRRGGSAGVKKNNPGQQRGGQSQNR